MQWYESVAQILLIGIANGSLIALVALGYTLVYGIVELINVGLHWKGASQVDFPNLLPNIDIFRDVLKIDTRVHFGLKDLFVIALALPLAYGLNLFVRRTRLGKAMRATAQDREAAAMMGIDINTTIMLTFLLGGALAGAAGMMYGLYDNTAWFFQGIRSGLYAFPAAVMGGIG